MSILLLILVIGIQKGMEAENEEKLDIFLTSLKINVLKMTLSKSGIKIPRQSWNLDPAEIMKIWNIV